MRPGLLRAYILAAAVVSAVGAAGAYAQTQMEMNEQSGARLDAAEAEMRNVIGELESKASGKPKALEVFRDAQIAWEKYRDGQLRALWPSPETKSYGSVTSMCLADTKAEMTRARIRELRVMLNAIEGDVCGSQWPENETREQRGGR